MDTRSDLSVVLYQTPPGTGILQSHHKELHNHFFPIYKNAAQNYSIEHYIDIVGAINPKSFNKGKESNGTGRSVIRRR